MGQKFLQQRQGGLLHINISPEILSGVLRDSLLLQIIFVPFQQYQ